MRLYQRGSMKKRILVFMTIGSFLILMLLFFYNIVSENELKRESAKQYQNILSEQVQQMDQRLSQEVSTLVLFAINNVYAMDMERAKSYSDFYFAANNAKNDIATLYQEALTEAVFILKDRKDNYGENPFSYIYPNTVYSIDEKVALEAYVHSLTLDDIYHSNYNWESVKIGSKWYFVYYFRGADYAIGSCIRAESLVESLSMEQMEESVLTLMNDNGEGIVGSEKLKK